MKLRYYQRQLNTDIHSGWGAGHKNVLAVLGTGLGKTVCFTEILQEHAGVSFAIAHRQELVGQMSLTLAKRSIKHNIVAPSNIIRNICRLHAEETGDCWFSPNAHCHVAGVNTLTRRMDNLRDVCNQVSLWVVDECFPAGTLVDGKSIEFIRVGDMVTAFDENTGKFYQRKVTRTFKNPKPSHMVSLDIKGHHVLNCTSEHPFWTKRGWVKAGELTPNDEVLFNDKMHNLRERSGFNRVQKKTVERYGAGVLFKKLLKDICFKTFFRNRYKDKQKICIGTHEKKQPNEKPGNPEKSVRYIKKDGSQTKDTGRERKTSNNNRTNNIRQFEMLRIQKPVDSKNKKQSIFSSSTTKSLQNRCGSQGSNACDRNRWKQSLYQGTTKTRQEERTGFNWVGLDSVTIQESGSINELGTGDENNYVYNIEVEEFHTYIANGIVVHNCHHILKRNLWGKAIELFPNAKGLGVTATPLRADGHGLGSHHDGVFDTMVQGPQMRDMINQGFLTDYRIFAPPSDLDLAPVDITASGDYSKKQLSTQVKRSHITGDIVQHYLRIAPGKLGITFVTDVETAHDVAAKYNAAGVPAVALSAKTPLTERMAALRKFKNREILQLVNVDLFSEGFDLPAIEVISMGRPTCSYGWFVQAFGRALRPMEGKDRAIIIDHVGNVMRHGLPDTPRVWTLDRREKRSKSKATVMVTSCPSCTGVYERFLSRCPYCGFKAEPANRSHPEFVDGDLLELDIEALARLRGAVDESEVMRFPMGASDVVVNSVKKQHRLRQETQGQLRGIMRSWGDARRALGKPDSESYREFYIKYGIDVLSAQCLKRADTEKLIKRIITG